MTPLFSGKKTLGRRYQLCQYFFLLDLAQLIIHNWSVKHIGHYHVINQMILRGLLIAENEKAMRQHNEEIKEPWVLTVLLMKLCVGERKKSNKTSLVISVGEN